MATRKKTATKATAVEPMRLPTETPEEHKARVAAAKEAERALEKNAEYQKAHGLTESQQEIRDYHEGDFQDTDPVTGEARGKLHPYADTARLERAGEEDEDEK